MLVHLTTGRGLRDALRGTLSRGAECVVSLNRFGCAGTFASDTLFLGSLGSGLELRVNDFD